MSEHNLTQASVEQIVRQGGVFQTHSIYQIDPLALPRIKSISYESKPSGPAVFVYGEVTDEQGNVLLSVGVKP